MKDKINIKLLISNFLLLGCAVTLVSYLVIVGLNGRVLICEPNPVTYWIEIALLVGIIAFAISNIIRGMK